MAFGNVNSAVDATLDAVSIGMALKVTGAVEPELLKGMSDVGSYHAVLGYAIEEYLADPTDEKREHLAGIFNGDIDAEQWAKDEGWF